MPELPDLCIYLEALEQRIGDQGLEGIDLRSPFLLRSVSPTIDEVAGLRVVELGRLGKRLLIVSGTHDRTAPER